MKKTIKLMVMLLLAATLTTLISCSKESSYKTRIVGTWQCTESSIDILWREGDKYRFQADGTISRNPGTNQEESAVYQINNNKLIVMDLLAVGFQIEELSSTTMRLSYNGSGNATLRKL